MFCRLRPSVPLRLASALACFFAVVQAATAVVVWAPDNYVGVIEACDGEVKGPFPAILRAVSKYSGDSYEVRPVSWPRAVYEAEAGNGGICCFSVTVAGRAQFDYSESVMSIDLLLIVRAGDEANISSVADLKGRRVGYQARGVHGLQFEAMVSRGDIIPEPDSDPVSRLRKLLAGRSDVALFGATQAAVERVIVGDSRLRANAAKLVILKVSASRDPLYVAFAKSANAQPVLQRFDAGLRALRKSGGYERLLAAPGCGE